MTMSAHPHTWNLESLYLLTPAKLGADGPTTHSIRLTFVGHGDTAEMTGTLSLDPNACSLNAFGDREMCTKIAVRAIAVAATLQRLGDPKHLGRSFYALHGEGLPHGVALIVYPRGERIYLKAEHALVALFAEDGA